MQRIKYFLFLKCLSNGHRNRETPEPIPNSEAKPAHDMQYCSKEWESILLFGTILEGLAVAIGAAKARFWLILFIP